MSEKYIVLDTNVFVLYILGQLGLSLIEQHPRISEFTEEDYHFVKDAIDECNTIVTAPNIITEVDNLINRTFHTYQHKYHLYLQNILNVSIEKLYYSQEVMSYPYFEQLGFTDAILLRMAKNSTYLISADSQLCDYALSLGIHTIDMGFEINKRLLQTKI